MTVKVHKFNGKLSKEVYENCKSYLEMKKCYNNIFNVASDFLYYDNFVNSKWRIAYGYYSVLDNIFARHCFIVNEDNEVIDPTIFTQPTHNERQESEYISFKIFDDIDEYTEAIWKDNREPALYRFLRDIEMNRAYTWAKENNKYLIG